MSGDEAGNDEAGNTAAGKSGTSGRRWFRRGRSRDYSDTAIAARRDPWWINSATLRGLALIVAGVMILSSPATEQLIRPILGLLLVLWAGTEFWLTFRARTRAGQSAGSVDGSSEDGRSWTTILVAAVGGLMLILLDDLGVTVVIGLVAIFRGIFVLLRNRKRGGGPVNRNRLQLGFLLIVLGGVLIVVPDAAILAVRAGIGLAALAIGGILLAMGLSRKDGQLAVDVDIRSGTRLVGDWVANRRLELDHRRTITETLFFEPPNRSQKLGSFWVMMILASTIASFAVVQDSTAVVIGAMLVAPLMTPIMGISAAAVNGWAARLIRSLLLVLFAVAAAIAVAWLISAWLPSVGQLSTNSAVSSRVEPTLVDLGIAIAAGAAGAYATVDPRVSSSLSGVAVAVALVPPLSVVGITLESGEFELARGALLLFLTNFVSIVLTATVVFVLMGYAVIPPKGEQRVQLRRVMVAFGAGALIIAVPLSLTSLESWDASGEQSVAEELLEDWLPTDGSLELLDVEVEDDTIDVTLTGSEIPENTDSVTKGLARELDHPVKMTMRLIPSEVRVVEGS